MIPILCICVAVTFGVSVFLLLGRELKGLAMGVFLLGHAANLAILAGSGSPIKPQHLNSTGGAGIKRPPLSDYTFDKALRSGEVADPLAQMVDPLPQALILTAIVIGFAVMGFLLSLLVVTSRHVGTLTINDLATPTVADTDNLSTGAGAAASDPFGPLPPRAAHGPDSKIVTGDGTGGAA